MTGRTHDLAAFTALHIVFLSVDIQPMTLGTAVVAFGANFIGGLFPDIDQPTSDLWDNFRWGEAIGKFVCKLLGGHRHISHSLVGVALFGFGASKFLDAIDSLVLVDMQVVWWSFMIGVLSHIIFDMPTKEGVPLFWPIRIPIGIPPIRALRIRSGYFVENFVVFPALLATNMYLFYYNYDKILHFLKFNIS